MKSPCQLKKAELNSSCPASIVSNRKKHASDIKSNAQANGHNVPYICIWFAVMLVALISYFCRYECCRKLVSKWIAWSKFDKRQKSSTNE